MKNQVNFLLRKTYILAFMQVYIQVVIQNYSIVWKN